MRVRWVPSPGLRLVLLLSVLASLSLTSRDGQAWSASRTGLPTGPAPDAEAAATTYIEVVGGLHHTCALTAANGVKCWGRNQYGQLGNGTNTDSTRPVDVMGLTSDVTAIAANGGDHTCALIYGAVQCWGYNAWGQLGNNTQTHSNVPVDVMGLSGVVAIAAGGDHSCAALTGGMAMCWGLNNYGQLGHGDSGNAWLGPVDVMNLTGVSAMAAGGLHTCAIDNGGLECWGSNFNGQLGIGVAPTMAPDTAQCTNPAYDGCRAIPFDVSGLAAGVTAVAASGAETCAVHLGGAKCWGYNAFGQSGNGTQSTTPPNYPNPSPVDVTGLTNSVADVESGNQSCALTTAGAALCWGLNSVGQVGDGTTMTRTTPVGVFGLGSGVSIIGNGSRHTCAGLAAGGMKCWGANDYGQMGNGTTTGLFTANPFPIDVVGDLGVITGQAYQRCAEIGMAPCPEVVTHKTFLATDDKGGLSITVSGADVGEGFTWEYFWPINDPDDGVRAAVGACPTRILAADHPDNASANVALVSYCPYATGTPAPEVSIEFPGGCPCSFTHTIYVPLSGEDLAIEPVGGAHPGTWEVRIDRVAPDNTATQDVIVDQFYVKPVPAVLLVHGYGSSCPEGMPYLEPWLEAHLVDAADFPHTAQYDAPERVECFDPPGGKPPPNDSGYDWKLGTVVIGNQLKQAIEGPDGFLERSQPLPGGEIDIVAHSYGGLNSRWYIEKVKGGNAPVRTLTMLGTPNKGTAASDGAVIQDVGLCLGVVPTPPCLADIAMGGLIDDVGAWDMRLASNLPGGILYQLNSGWTAPSTDYRVEVGNISPGAAPAAWSYFWSLFLLGPNDCLVPVSSAEGPFPPGASIIWDGRSHKSTCDFPAVNNDPSADCAADSAHVFCDIAFMLDIPVKSGPVVAPEPPPTAPEAAVSSQAALSAAVATTGGHLDAGGNASHPAAVDASATRASFALTWDASAGASMRLTLETPSGGMITSSGPGILHAPAVDTSDGFSMETYTVDAPEAGTWLMHVEALAAPAEGVSYSAGAPVESPVTMSVTASGGQQLPGATFDLSATLADGASPVLGATVEADVQKPDGAVATVQLLDNGSGPDTTAGDGSYAATFSDTSLCGVYIVTFDASGVAGSGAFERSALTFLETCPDSDRDGCGDFEETGPDPNLGGGRDPFNPYDFYDITNLTAVIGARDKRITGFDLSLLVSYGGTADGGGPNAMGKDYNADTNANTIDDGFEIDFAGIAGPASGPDGAITGFDLSSMVNQGGDDCQAPP